MLFYTMIDLNSEDVMYNLIFAYLTPCRHLALPSNIQQQQQSSASCSQLVAVAASSTGTTSFNFAELSGVSVQALLSLSTQFSITNSETSTSKVNYIQPTSATYLNENFPINRWLNSM